MCGRPLQLVADNATPEEYDDIGYAALAGSIKCCAPLTRPAKHWRIDLITYHGTLTPSMRLLSSLPIDQRI